MSNCAYHFIVTKHPRDGVEMACRQCPSDVVNPLVLLTCGGEDTALSLGYSLPDDYPGLAGGLTYNLSQIATRIPWGERHFAVVFPRRQSTSINCSMLLDMMRPRLAGLPYVAVIIDLARAEYDLPPLMSEDHLSCYWECRDHLGPKAKDELSYVLEKTLDEQPQFGGLIPYVRNQDSLPRAEQRREQITQALEVPTASEILVLGS